MSGPDKDHTTGFGYFIFLGEKKNSHGGLISDWHKIEDGKNTCINFYYHMYGSSVYSMQVYAIDADNQPHKIWEKFGSQGKIW